MANNCLVTKLKAFIDNDNLPILDTVCLYTTALTNPYYNGSDSGTNTLLIYCTESVTVTTTSNFINPTNGNDYSYNTVTINPGVIGIVGIKNKSNDIITINNAHAIKCISIPSVIDNNVIKDTRSGFDQLTSLIGLGIHHKEYKQGLYSVNDVYNIKYLSSLRFLALSLPDILDIDNKRILESGHIEWYKVNSILENNVNTITYLNTEPIFYNSTLDLSNDVIINNIENLPITIESIRLALATSYGSFDNLISRFRSNGRTNGVISYILTGDTANNLIVNGSPINPNHKYIIWDNNTITTTATKPEGFEDTNLMYTFIQKLINEQS